MYETDREQLDLLKNFWREYGRWIVVAVMAGLALGYVWRGWKMHQTTQEISANEWYQKVLVLQAKNIDVAEEVKTVNELKHQFPNTAYASLGALVLATQSANAQQYDVALSELQWVATQGSSTVFKDIANIRIARLEAQQSHWTQALSALSKITDTDYQPLADETRGDIYRAEHNEPLAHKAYQQAMEGYQRLNIDNPLLKMKLAT